ncbi:hypothetical protein CCACVL1_30440 [Corchorus capsularis]|uniref:Uncharacterized protein n=1 Tax=Corchorus capsularis TaxID=210143 RepID=A0A1R3FX59_COCAP|nr:hypothetical protein CCACVL1_30440 [Corchorus capsularis]
MAKGKGKSQTALKQNGGSSNLRDQFRKEGKRKEGGGFAAEQIALVKGSLLMIALVGERRY